MGILIGAGILVSQECACLRDCRNAPDDVEIDTAQKLSPIGQRGWRDVFTLPRFGEGRVQIKSNARKFADAL